MRFPPPSEKVGIYTHLPFCRSRCSYCGFFTTSTAPHLMEPYLVALKKEIEIAAASEPAAGLLNRALVDTVYFGGGSPSILPADSFEGLLEIISNTLQLAEAPEITIEANPIDISQDYVRSLKMAGVNRISLGVQTLDRAVLKLMGRRHDPCRAKDAFHICREEKIAGVSVDLILGFPLQRLDSFKNTLDEVLSWKPDHISGYMLDLKDNSRLASQIAAKRIEPPEDELMAQMWDLLVSQCISGGYEHYEISNFAMPGHRSTHNMKYWRDKEFIGFGAAASSMTGRHRYANTENMEDYINASGNGFLPIENLQELAPFDRFKDSLIMGMRLTNGVDAARLSEDYHIDAFGYLHETIGDLIDLGLFEISGNIFRLTKKGMLLSNQVFVRWL